jgi:hypothetical protein
MKRALSVLYLLGIVSISVFADEAQSQMKGFTLILGPRLGYAYSFMSQSGYDNLVSSTTNGSFGENYFQGNTVFGISFEQRVLLGKTNDYFAVQELLSIDGLEQSIGIPIASVLLGYRDESGLELGIGPVASVAGVSLVGSVGWIVEYKDIHIPVDIGVTLPNNKVAASISLTTGFNFEVGKR